MSEPSTPLTLPPNLPYPITITRILSPPQTSIKRGDPLLEYAFTSDTSRRALSSTSSSAQTKRGGKDDARENDMIGSWESAIDGEVEKWDLGFKPGSRVEAKHIGKKVVWVRQACSHPVQLHGLCGICGADLATDDYLSQPTGRDTQAGPSRYPGGFELAHDALGVTVSTDEARRLETQTRETLLEGRRLSLIVDLDQTIIHTTVDPTVGEWMAGIEEDGREMSDTGEDGSPSGARKAGKEEGGEQNGRSSTPTTSPPSKSVKEQNPNSEALKDVARFQLADDLPPGYRGRGVGRWYYTKPRPGLERFLTNMSTLYEMHVYTMGTRSYANAICSVIDPSGAIFGGRILSRDESGSLSQKNLKRLFPTDQSMVVVIDDRSDVWGDCPNLVKVVPYDFFVGIGDINGSFLPQTPSTPALSPSPASSVSPASSGQSSLSSLLPETPPESSGLIAQAKLLDEVSEARPLAKLQEELEKDEAVEGVETNGAAAEQPHGKKSETPPGSPTKARKPLLNAFDDELDRVARVLKHVHSAFYDAYDDRTSQTANATLPMGCDVELIIPDLKSRVLAGCSLVFSGVIPRHVQPESSDIWTTAEAFGARCQLEVTPNTTHCVTATLGTEKTYRAGKVPGAKVVWLEWFWKSVAVWRRQNEDDYLAVPNRVESNGSGSATPAIVLGDDQAEVEEDGGDGAGWDEDAQAELDAFLEGSSDVGGTEDGRTDLDSVPSPPGTPSKKRVRYADEEHLPLESFKDPSPTEAGTSPPKRRRLLLGAPEEGDVPKANKFQWATKGKVPDVGTAYLPPDGEEVADGEDEEDEFAQMLADSLDG